MKIVSFHLKGKMAHFRKYYSNSSCLTYLIPPRTTICGILAGILGMERDTYYQEFSLDNCNIAVGLKSPIKKRIFTMNLLKVEKNNDLNGSQPFHSQTPTEMVLPMNIRDGSLHYQIWVHHKNEEIMRALFNILGQSKYGYGSLFTPVSLGTAYNLGWIECEGEIEGSEKSNEEILEFHSVLPVRKLKDLSIDCEHDNLWLIREELPLEFDNDRRITEQGLGNVIISLDGKPLKARLENYVELSNYQRIVWLQ